MSLQIYNSLTEQKETFTPIHENHVSLYVCGPTVYSDSHLGHGKTYVNFDVMLRYFKYLGNRTFYVQNITDVGHLVGDGDEGEDKILKKAREANTEPMAIAEYYTRKHQQAMEQLAVLPPDIVPRATGHIPEQLEAIQQMIDQDIAYEVNGSVYFDISKDSQYGILSNRSQEEMVSGTRVEVRSEKRNPHDFALWKKADPEHIMGWTDSWSGRGYPGWHTECVVMSTKYLGAQFDIHGGGMDLKFPHHECEMAQARALEKPFANYWLHGNMLTIEGQKMSKSLGNFITLDDVFQQYSPLVLRYFFISGHYRSVLDYSISAMQAVENSLKRLHQVTRRLREFGDALPKASGNYFQELKTRFEAAMNDDFSTPQALAVLFELTKEVNSILSENQPNLEALADAEKLFTQLGGDVLGIIPDSLESGHNADATLDDVMQLVIELRSQARQTKNWDQADLIRDQLKAAGIQLKDSPDATTWERIESN